MADIKWSQFPSVTPDSADEVVGLHSGYNARFTLANIIAAFRQGLSSIFVPLTRTINGQTLDNDITLDAADVGARADTWMPSASDVGAQPTINANGILKGDGQGGVSAAVAGTDYQAPLTAGTDYATPSQLEDKANPGQIGYPESGTTASRNYTAGEYICWNGLTYTADSNIATGATLSASGGNKNLTECVGGGLNNQRIKILEFPFTTATLGTSFSQTSRAIGTTQNLFGIDATRILSIFVRDSTLTPAANLIFGIWGGTLYMAATQSCTLSDSLPIRIVVTYY